MLNRLLGRLQAHAPTAILPKPGVYHYLRQEPNGKARIHLRLEANGSGVLMVNASRMYQLNPTAALMAHLALEQKSEDQAAALLSNHYQVDRSQAMQDFRAFQDQLQALTSPEGACPICELELEVTQPFTSQPSAPYRMDLALTYRCNNQCSHCYNARSRQYPELSVDQWHQVLDQLWSIGIPHIVFTGGEPTLVPFLPELIAHAEKNGQITGINTNGRRLKDAAYVQSLVDAGLDHVQITLESHDPEIHDHMVAAPGAWKDTTDGLRNALNTRMFVMTNTTLLTGNAPYLSNTLDFLAELGVPTLGLNALIFSGRGRDVGTGIAEQDLPSLLNLAREKTTASGQRLIWYTPTQYCHFDPVQMELGVKGCTAAYYNMCVEPDGQVIPCQSYYQGLGNLLSDPWDSIWNHDMALDLRERRSVPQECTTCSLLPECGGGCPLSRQITSEINPAVERLARRER